MYCYRSYHDLGLAVWRAIPRLGKRFDVVVGIPRSGLIPALMMALYQDSDASSLDLFLEGKVFSHGMTRAGSGDAAGGSIRPGSSVLVIDDSISSGTAMRKAKERIASSGIVERLGLSISTAAVYYVPAYSQYREIVDFAFEPCPAPRVFQWNVFNHPEQDRFLLDIDGIVCQDPTEEENDDGVRYLEFLKSATPRFRTRFPVGGFVTSRLEKYREPTEEWLARNGFRHETLAMLDLPTKEARIKAGCHASFKASVFSKSDKALFLESDCRQALEIASTTGKDVFCSETMTLFTSSDAGVGTISRTYLELLHKLWLAECEVHRRNKALFALKNSLSFRAGRFVTAPFRFAHLALERLLHGRRRSHNIQEGKQ